MSTILSTSSLKLTLMNAKRSISCCNGIASLKQSAIGSTSSGMKEGRRYNSSEATTSTPPIAPPSSKDVAPLAAGSTNGEATSASGSGGGGGAGGRPKRRLRINPSGLIARSHNMYRKAMKALKEGEAEPIMPQTLKDMLELDDPEAVAATMEAGRIAGMPISTIKAKKGDDNVSVEIVNEKDVKWHPNDFFRKSRPFPRNPTFKITQPLSDKTRTTIFELFRQDPGRWSPRAVAETFGISVDRATAILRLKALSAQMTENNIPIQTEYVKGMERMLNPHTIPLRTSTQQGSEDADPVEILKYNGERREAIREIIVSGPYTPFGLLLDEETQLTPTDAAKMMARTPYANITHRLNLQASQMFKEKPPVSTSEGDLTYTDRTEVLGGGRGNFMIVDTSHVDALRYHVREGKGGLREADRAEVYQKRVAKPKGFRM